MLTQGDIKDLISAQSKVFATKDDVGQLKEHISRVEEKVDSLITSVDGLAKLVKDFRDEHIVLHRRIEMLETWARKVSAQVGIPLPT